MKTLQLTLILLLTGLTGLPYGLWAQTASHNFTLEPLPYNYDALEPYIDRLTVETHYSRHHRAYYDNFIKAIQGTEMEKMSIGEIFSNISKYGVAVRNNGGGYYNHNVYWENMKPGGGGIPDGSLAKAIEKKYGSFQAFKQQFEEAAKTRFGSGWVWLCYNSEEGLFICSTPNQDNPLMDVAEKKGIPLLALDVWEHAYYLKYQNKRADYVTAFWNVLNWDRVEERFEKASRE
ncbi:MAG TPA: superoxide dismutase [Bacteroidales bacterium]|nr:superoxide dismutase [Bacteroidales bacterium]